jgi:PAS domain S-box-containing protein
MNKSLRILLVEDSADDAELILSLIRRGGYEVSYERVQTEQTLRAALTQSDWDIVLSDYRMPSFDAPAVLKILREMTSNLPTIIVSGTVGEKVAVETLQLGADDYLLKGNLTRLVPAIERAMLQVDDRRARHRAEIMKTLMMSNSMDIICTIDAAGRFVEVSEAAATIWGYATEELVAKPFLDLVHPDDRERTRTEAELIQHGRHTRGFENRYLSKAGNIVEMNWSACWLESSQIMIGVGRDATEQKKNQEILRVRDMALASVSQSVLICNEHRLATYANPGFTAITGYEEHEILGRKCSILQGPGTNPETVKKMRATLDAGHHFTGEILNYRKDGQLFWNELSITPFQNGQDGTLCFIGIQRDITESKIARERLREQAEMLDLAQDAIIIRDIQSNRITFWNKGAERLYGWTTAEATQREIGELIFRDPQRLEEVTQAVIEHGKWQGELLQITKLKKEIIVDGRATLARDAAGRPKSVLVINTDITQKKELEAQFLRAQRMESIGTLASGVAHDLNNILAPILMMAQLLKKQALAPDLLDAMASIEGCAKRGAAIIKQVLTFARGVEGDRILVQCVHLVKEMVKIARETFPKSITITTEVSGEILPVLGDPTQLHQVLLNLCINARDAMPDGGRLKLSVQNVTVDPTLIDPTTKAAMGPYVLLTVADNGKGIPAAVIDKIFDPFFTTKAFGQGTGLGLSTVLGIIKSHAGFIQLESRPDQGTTFKIYLPAAPLEGAAKEQTALVEDLRGEGELILVVDDEPDIRVATEAMLRQQGYEVITAADGTEALTLCAQQGHRVAVVLTDVLMPYFDGVSLTRALKKIRPELSVIVASGLNEEKRWDELKSLGVKQALLKPYDSHDLLKALRDVLNK